MEETLICAKDILCFCLVFAIAGQDGHVVSIQVHFPHQFKRANNMYIFFFSRENAIFFFFRFSSYYSRNLELSRESLHIM